MRKVAAGVDQFQQLSFLFWPFVRKRERASEWKREEYFLIFLAISSSFEHKIQASAEAIFFSQQF